jgi:hypothetical protein
MLYPPPSFRGARQRESGIHCTICASGEMDSGLDAEPVIGPANRPDPLASPRNDDGVFCSRRATKQPDGQITSTSCDPELSTPAAKNIPLHYSRKSVAYSACPTRHEGRIAIVTNARWDAVDARAAQDERKQPRTAKSCGPGAPTLALSLREASSRRRRWQESPVTEESTK